MSTHIGRLYPFRSKLDLMGIRFADAGGDGGGAGDAGGDGGGDAPTYTPPASQADLDRIIESRLARERDKFKDYDDLKAKATEYQQHLDSQKDDTQKAIDQARGEATTEVTQKFLTRLVNSEAKTIASTLGFNDPADALSVIDREKLPVKDDEPDSDAIKVAIEQLAKDKPYLLKADAPRVRTRPKPAEGERQDTSNDGKGKGKAAAALRQLAGSRKSA